MTDALRKSLLDQFNPGSPEVFYLHRLFDLEDSQTTEEQLRLSALSYASQLGTTVHTDVLIAANGYLAFLKGETNEAPKGEE
jgi:hypothetical protein